jgi:hypothetical protein
MSGMEVTSRTEGGDFSQQNAGEERDPATPVTTRKGS